jgi:catechol 2,3-dioxygenase-like lactoylglutathione lyase family enzyme
MSLDAIGIIAADPAKSVAFYALLGIELKRMGEHEHFEGATPSGVRIMLDSVGLIRSFDPDWQTPTGSGVVLCFKQPSPAHVDSLYDQITQAGFSGKKAPWDAFWGQRYACMLDPDAHQIDLFATL